MVRQTIRVALFVVAFGGLTACMPQLSRNDFKHDSSLYAYFNQKSGSSGLYPGTLVADNNILWEAPASVRGCVRKRLVADGVPNRYAAPIAELVRGCRAEVDTSIVVAGISGGGHKSEVFALAVMEELDHYYTLLDDIDAVSSASGGSFAALIYALSCDKGDCEDKDSWRWVWDPRGDLHSIDALKEQNYLWPFFLTRLRPDHLFLNATTYHDSGESFVDVLTARMFENNPNVSFNDLNPNRPNLFLTATNLSRNREGLLPLEPNESVRSDNPAFEMHQRSSAQHFSFTQAYFGALDSDLGSFSLVRALVASAAFPLIIDPTTVRDYSDDQNTSRCAEWYPNSDCESFVHLTDGGVHDNIAVSELQWFIECTFADLLKDRPRAGTLQPFCDNQVFSNRGRPKVVLSIAIDASLTASDGRDNQKAEQRLASSGIPIRIGSTSNIVDMMSFSNTTQRKSDLAALSQELNANGTVAAFADFGLETLGDLLCIERKKCDAWRRVRSFAESHGRTLPEPKDGYMRDLYDRVRNVDVSFELSEDDRDTLAEAAPWIVARRVLQLCEEKIIQSMFHSDEAAGICRGQSGH